MSVGSAVGIVIGVLAINILTLLFTLYGCFLKRTSERRRLFFVSNTNKQLLVPCPSKQLICGTDATAEKGEAASLPMATTEQDTTANTQPLKLSFFASELLDAKDVVSVAVLVFGKACMVGWNMPLEN